MPKSVELSGPAVTAFMREFVRSERLANDELADALAERAGRLIRRMLVVRGAASIRRSGPRRRVKPSPRPADVPSNEMGAGTVRPAVVEPGKAADAAAPFDPYAFAVEAVLIKQGEAGLAARLEQIEKPSDLRALARAQRIQLEANVASDPEASASQLRQAIIRGAGKRLADRRAAAG